MDRFGHDAGGTVPLFGGSRHVYAIAARWRCSTMRGRHRDTCVPVMNPDRAAFHFLDLDGRQRDMTWSARRRSEHTLDGRQRGELVALCILGSVDPSAVRNFVARPPECRLGIAAAGGCPPGCADDIVIGLI